jgi:hypothetical protein
MVPGIEHASPQEIRRVEVERQLGEVGLDERDHSAILDADDMRGIVLVDVVGPVAEAYC